MKIKRDQTSSSQLMFSAGCFIQGSTLLTYGIHKFGKHEAWIAVLVGCLISLPVLGIYVSLAKKFPGKSLIEINNIVLGKILGRIFSVFYIFYFFTLVLLNTSDLGNFVGGFMLTQTPIVVVLAMFIFICCWAVRKGARTITRYGALFVFLCIIVIFFNSILLIKNVKTDNFLPLFSLPLQNYFEGAHVVAMLPICEIMAFFMLLPHLQNAGESGKVFFGGFAIGAVTLLITVARDTAVLGPRCALAPVPTFAVIRLVNIGNILTRMEILYAMILIMLLFFKVSILIFATVSGVKRLLEFDSYQFLVFTFGAIIVIFTIASFNSAMEHAYWLISGAAAIYATLFLLIMPAVTLIVAAARFKKKR